MPERQEREPTELTGCLAQIPRRPRGTKHRQVHADVTPCVPLPQHMRAPKHRQRPGRVAMAEPPPGLRHRRIESHRAWRSLAAFIATRNGVGMRQADVAQFMGAQRRELRTVASLPEADPGPAQQSPDPAGARRMG